MFSIVMPIIRFSYLLAGAGAAASPNEEHDNIQRFFRIGWPTFQEFIEWEDVHTFFVIVTQNDKSYFQTMFEKHVPLELQSKFKIIIETDLMKYPTQKQKYSTQMMSKLLIANHVKTKHYLIVDDDIVALRKFRMKDIFVNNKQIRYTHDTTYNENWWVSSAHVLDNMSITDLDKRKIMSVTPEILITREVKNLMKYLQRLHGDWEYKLMNMKERWTEYTLYWLYLSKQNKLDLYKKSTIPLSDNRTNIWFKPTNMNESIEKMFKNKKQYFGVIQSNVQENTYIAVEAAIKRIRIL
jgi:hypothetical protein